MLTYAAYSGDYPWRIITTGGRTVFSGPRVACDAYMTECKGIEWYGWRLVPTPCI